MGYIKKCFGTLSDGNDVTLFTIEEGELKLSLSSLGAALTSLSVPSREHGTDDILLGFSSFEGYVENPAYFGTTVGRFANRIRDGRFFLNGKEYYISKNKPDCSLHGGRLGFSRRLWQAEPYMDGDGTFVRFELMSPDGDQGYPGNLKASVSYGLTKNHQLVAVYEAKVDAPCPVNLTNHAYFNLAGEGRGMDVLSNEVRLACSSYVEVDESLFPTGRLRSVAGTPFDFRQKKTLGKDINQLTRTVAGGFDHCLAIDGEPGKLRFFGEIRDPVTGRWMTGYTTLPGVQLYTANMLHGLSGKSGSVYGPHDGLCLETQYFPDSPNQRVFPSAVFSPDREYYEKTVFTFQW